MTSATTQPRQDFLYRLLLVVAALLVLRLGQAIPLPGVDAELARAISARHNLPFEMFTLFALGVTPIVSSAVLLELAQLVAPSLRRRRRESGAAETAFRRAWLALSLFVAAFQAWGVARGMIGFDGLASGPESFGLLVITTTVGATTLLFWLAALITRQGFGEGLWLLFAATIVARATPALTSPLAPRLPIPLDSATIAGFLALLAIALAALVYLYSRIPTPSVAERVETIVWPVMIGYYGADVLVSLANAFAHWPPLYGVAHFALVFALILLVAFMRDGVASTPFGAKNLAFLALIETAVCVLLAVAAQAIVLPLGIDGPALLATFAALTGFAASLRRAT